jgi:hypothetical protein
MTKSSEVDHRAENACHSWLPLRVVCRAHPLPGPIGFADRERAAQGAHVDVTSGGDELY